MRLWDNDFRLKSGRRRMRNVERSYVSATAPSHRQHRKWLCVPYPPPVRLCQQTPVAVTRSVLLHCLVLGYIKTQTLNLFLFMFCALQTAMMPHAVILVLLSTCHMVSSIVSLKSVFSPSLFLLSFSLPLLWIDVMEQSLLIVLNLCLCQLYA